MSEPIGISYTAISVITTTIDTGGNTRGHQGARSNVSNISDIVAIQCSDATYRYTYRYHTRVACCELLRAVYAVYSCMVVYYYDVA